MKARWAGLVVLALVLVGCGGIPTSGSVQEGALIDEEDLPDVTYRALGPQAGATPEQIMQGFIAAATNPLEDYAVARSFLAEDVDWNPNEVTRIRTGVGVPRPESDTEFSYTLTSAAYVNNRGQYFEGSPTSEKLDFVLAQNSDEEWRITSAPDGIVLSQGAFGAIFDPYPLYYFDPTNNYLIPDLRWFPRTAKLSTRIVSTLLEGQASWLTQGVTTTYFPVGTELASTVSTEGDSATVDFNGQFLDAPAEQRQLMRQQLGASLAVSDVRITVNGVNVDIPESGAPQAILHPQVDDRLLVRRDDSFGYLTSAGSVSPLAGMSPEVIQLGALDATLARDRHSTAVLAADGAHLIFDSSADAVLVDARPGLVAAALDNAGFVWTIPNSDATAISAIDAEGTAHQIDGGQFAGRAISLSVSRDGARLLVLVATDGGPKLAVAGIVRRDGVPAQLGAAVFLTVDAQSIPLDAAWVDENTVATLTRADDSANATVTRYTLGGSSASAGRVEGGIAIAGGNGGADGLRVLTVDGDVYLPRGNGWADTNNSVTFIGTQQ